MGLAKGITNILGYPWANANVEDSQLSVHIVMVLSKSSIKSNILNPSIKPILRIEE